MRLFPLIFGSNPNADFIKLGRYATYFSLLLCLVSVALIGFKGFNFGIDFIGGTKLEIASSKPIDSMKLRVVVSGLNLGEVSVQSIEGESKFAIKVAGKGQDASRTIEAAINKSFPNHGIQYLTSCFVGPQINSYFVRSAFKAVLLCLLGIVAYVWWRFGVGFSLGVLAVLLHNILLSLGFASAFNLDMNQSSIAALLIILGYCVNDSIVIYDRLVHNFSLKGVNESSVGASINQTLSRNILTSLTTLLANLALIIFGCRTIVSFSLLTFVGIAIGTYSSIFLSSPTVLCFKNFKIRGVNAKQNTLEQQN